jgi:hypothetical protein
VPWWRGGRAHGGEAGELMVEEAEFAVVTFGWLHCKSLE